MTSNKAMKSASRIARENPHMNKEAYKREYLRMQKAIAHGPPPLIDDTMVERAWGAYSDPGDEASDQEEMDAIRTALSAALRDQPAT
jgi:hypothetical protein